MRDRCAISCGQIQTIDAAGESLQEERATRSVRTCLSSSTERMD